MLSATFAGALFRACVDRQGNRGLPPVFAVLGLLFVFVFVGCSQRQSADNTTEELIADVDSVDAPDGMVLIRGGRTMIGSDDGFPMERPIFVAAVQPFFLDEHEVTVGQFREFVEATGYETQAERFGNSAVIDEDTKEWVLRDGAYWKMPLGPDADAAQDDHPVTHVSWNDATAYAEWAGKRLPTEVEWEHAARGATNDRSMYSPGLAIDSDGFPVANIWQGTFPFRNTGADGYFYTAPVGSFGRNSLGLMDMAGNVWEWTSSWYRPYNERGLTFKPDEFSAKVQRGGSFLCNDGWCHGFRVSARGQSTPESSHFHVGFRCAQDIPGIDYARTQ